MNETNAAGNNFIGYEYKDMQVSKDMEAVYADGFANFGWLLESSDAANATHKTDTVHLKLKRDRKIRNKAELTRLQHQFEACAGEITSLERSKTVSASIAAYAVGLVGTAFMAGSVFSYIGGLLLPSIVLAVPGFLGWIIPYFAYCMIRQAKTVELNPIIDQRYDQIYTTCEKANSLVNG